LAYDALDIPYVYSVHVRTRKTDRGFGPMSAPFWNLQFSGFHANRVYRQFTELDFTEKGD
jgi:hypothetical protein